MIKSGATSKNLSSGSRRGGGRLVLRLLLVWTLITAFSGAGPAQAAGPTCVTKSPTGSYSVRVCLTVGTGTTLTGDAAASATVTITGSSPGIRKLEFSLDGSYLITDFESPYAFTLPTASFLDGSHTMRADVLLRDNNTVTSAGVSAAFANGTTSPPPPATGFSPTSGRPAGPGETFVVAATGDGASGQKASDDVVGLVDSWNPNLFLYTGDVYEKGTETEFLNWYGPQGTRYGKFKAITNPIIGNHEYENGEAPGYFTYWSGVPDYYSYDAGGWHFIGLNSNSQLDSFDPGSAQYTWLQGDLEDHQKACTLAYFHHPVLSVGPQGNTPAMNSIWKLLADNGVDVVLTGHEHQYQRWVPLDGDFNRAPGGMVQLVAGGGGHGIQSTVRTDSRVAAVADTTADGFGALRMELSGGSMLYSYVNPGGTVRDSGTITCSGLPPDSTPPSIPGDVTATTSGNPDVTVAWSTSTDNQGVASYDIQRDNQTVMTVPATQTSWLDTTTAPLTTYDYSVRATDATGNASGWSPAARVTTPDVQTSFTWLVSEDAYVDGAKPSSRLGTRPDLRVDASPVQTTYLKFQVTGVGTRAPTVETLRVRASSSLAAGFDVRAVPDSGWSESTITYANAPSVGAVIATSGPVTGGSWVEIPVAGLISGDGTYTVALVARSTTALKLDARESGASAQLLADTTGSTGNAPPVASSLSVTTDEDTPVDWIPQVFDADGDTLTCSIDAPPAHGQATVAGNGCATGTYVPDPNTAGPDSFTYRVSDGTLSATGTVTVTVNPVNDAPVAEDVPGSLWANSSTTLTLTATDIDGDCPLTFEVTPPEHGTLSPVGTVTCSAGTATAPVTYSPAADWTGTDTFTYLARDPGGLQGQAQGAVSVTSAPASFTVQAGADAYVSDSAPSTNYGASKSLRVDGAAPVQRSYIRLAVDGLGTTPPTQLTLRVHAGSSLSAGFEVHASGGSWDESTLAWSSAPPPGDLLAISGPVSSGTWVEIALPPGLLPTGDGTVDLTLTPLSSTALRLDSRESGSGPQLVVTR